MSKKERHIKVIKKEIDIEFVDLIPQLKQMVLAFDKFNLQLKDAYSTGPSWQSPGGEVAIGQNRVEAKGMIVKVHVHFAIRALVLVDGHPSLKSCQCEPLINTSLFCFTSLLSLLSVFIIEVRKEVWVIRG